ncbi:MAG: hypothetical protein RL512_986 [Bacteroidota bacterium]|jgi:cbb3-type cytochrome oxidase subunit 3
MIFRIAGIVFIFVKANKEAFKSTKGTFKKLNLNLWH